MGNVIWKRCYEKNLQIEFEAKERKTISDTKKKTFASYGVAKKNYSQQPDTLYIVRTPKKPDENGEKKQTLNWRYTMITNLFNFSYACMTITTTWITGDINSFLCDALQQKFSLLV